MTIVCPYLLHKGQTAKSQANSIGLSIFVIIQLVNGCGILGIHLIRSMRKIAESLNIRKLLREGNQLLIAYHVPGTVLSALLAYSILTAAL